MNIPHFICSFIHGGTLGLFLILAIKNNAMNIHVQVFVWIYILISLGYIPRSRITQSDCNSMFNILRNCQTVFQSSCTILHSHQRCMRAPVCPKPCQHVLLPAFFILFILVDLERYLIVVLTYIFLMADDIEHLFICSLSAFISSEKYVFRSFAHFKIGLFAFLLLGVKCSLYNQVQVSFQIYNRVDIFLHSLSCRFTFLVVSFEA